jgi:hypothetical protein
VTNSPPPLLSTRPDPLPIFLDILGMSPHPKASTPLPYNFWIPQTRATEQIVSRTHSYRENDVHLARATPPFHPHCRYPGLRKSLMKIAGGMKELEGEKGVKEAVDAAMEALKMIERAGFAEEEAEVDAEGGVEEVGTNTTPGKEGGGGGGEKIGELEGRLKEARERARAEGDAREAAEGRVEELEGELNSLRESLLHVRDAIRADRDALCGERDAAVSERDALRSECGLLRSEMDALSSERDAAVSERDALSHGAQVLRGEVDALSQQVRHTPPSSEGA